MECSAGKNLTHKTKKPAIAGFSILNFQAY